MLSRKSKYGLKALLSLAREVDHRARNALAIVQAIVVAVLRAMSDSVIRVLGICRLRG